MSTTTQTLEERIADKAKKIVEKRIDDFRDNLARALRSLDPSETYSMWNPLHEKRAKSLLAPLLADRYDREMWPQFLMEEEIDRQRKSLLDAVEEVKDLMDRVDRVEDF